MQQCRSSVTMGQNTVTHDPRPIQMHILVTSCVIPLQITKRSKILLQDISKTRAHLILKLNNFNVLVVRN